MRSSPLLLALVLACAPVLAQGGDQVAAGAGLLWVGGYGGPRISLIGDVDGDGLADFLGLYPTDGGILDYVRTSKLGKPVFMVQARRPFGDAALAVACADLDGEPGVEVAAALPDGSVRVAAAFNRETKHYDREDTACTVPAEILPAGPGVACALDADGDGRTDIVMVGDDNRALLLLNDRSDANAVKLRPVALAGWSGTATTLTSGSLDGGKRGSLIWITPDASVYAARLAVTADGAALNEPVLLCQAQPGEGIVVGRFTGSERSDVIVGSKLLPGGDAARATFVPGLPGLAEARTDVAWLAGDVDGDGRDDILRHQRSGDRFTGDDVVLLPMHDAGAASASADSDGDGLLDSWETGEVKPGGLDLPGLGCSPGHRDIIVEVQRFAKADEEKVKAGMEKAVVYYASLPVDNPDGKPGLALHPIYREPIPDDREGQSWQKLGEEFHPKEHQGITHWMLIGSGGGGQSGQMADRGSCGVGAMYATFVHEFGHQIGLDHTGYWGPAWCPTYPSLMNYAYSYQLGGSGDKIGYSFGRLAHIVLNEKLLSERLPAPMDDASFLSGPPYRYKLKPGPDPYTTLVDWNWNGVFGEEGISADINYGYSTSPGLRHHLGKTKTAPALAAVGEGDSAQLLLFAGDKPKGEGDDLRLYVRLWLGTDPGSDPEGDRWSDEVDIEPAGVTGDPSAASAGGTTFLAYPKKDGVHAATVSIDTEGKVSADPSLPVPGTDGATPILAGFQGKLALLLWRGADKPVAVRFGGTPTELAASQETELPLVSLVPVGAAEGAPENGRPVLWIGMTENQDEKRPSRWQVRKLVRGEDGTFTEAWRDWIGGEGAQHRGEQRATLLWEPSTVFPDGQVHFLQCGMLGADSHASCHYIGTRVENQDILGGWLVRRYCDEWSQSASGPAACFFRGDFAYAMRWYAAPGSESADRLIVTFHGRGIEAAPMGDSDDVAVIRDVGLTHSIPCVVE